MSTEQPQKKGSLENGLNLSICCKNSIAHFPPPHTGINWLLWPPTMKCLVNALAIYKGSVGPNKSQALAGIAVAPLVGMNLEHMRSSVSSWLSREKYSLRRACSLVRAQEALWKCSLLTAPPKQSHFPMLAKIASINSKITQIGQVPPDVWCSLPAKQTLPQQDLNDISLQCSPQKPGPAMNELIGNNEATSETDTNSASREQPSS